MKSIELFRKIGYKQRCNTYHCVIYDLKNNVKDKGFLPTTIIINKNKNGEEVEFERQINEEHTHFDIMYINVNIDLLKAIQLKIEELDKNKSKLEH